MSSWEYFPCIWCREGKFLVNVPSNYDGNPPIRTVCRNQKCREKEKIYQEAREGGRKRKEKIERIEREIAQNNANIEEIKKKLKENENNYREQEAKLEKETEKIPKIHCSQCSKEIATGTYYQDPDNSQNKYCQTCAQKVNDNDNVNFSSNNQQQFGKCEQCKKSFREGDQYFYFPQFPEKKICLPCKPQVDTEIWAAQQIMQNKEVDLDSLNIHPESRIALKALQQIMAGQEVNVDNLPIDEENKQGLRIIQQQIKDQQPISPPDSSDDSLQTPHLATEEFLINCLTCQRQYQLDYKTPTCLYCQSSQVENYKGEVLQPKPLTQIDARQKISFRCHTCQKPIKQGEEYAKVYCQGDSNPQTNCVPCAKRLEKQLDQSKATDSQQLQPNFTNETQKWKIIAFTCGGVLFGLGFGLILYYFFFKKSAQSETKN